MGEEGRANGGELLAFGLVDVRKDKIQIVEGFEHGACHVEACEPFVVSGNNVPGNVIGGGMLNRCLLAW